MCKCIIEPLRVGGGGGGGHAPPKISHVFPCSLKVFCRFLRSLFPKISETQLLFLCSELYFPFFPFSQFFCGHVPLFPKTPGRGVHNHYFA